MKPRSRTPRSQPPRLHNGDHLSQEEFPRRYEAHPEDVKFELIGGVVYMASPPKRKHGLYHFELSLVLGLYDSRTPGIEGAVNLTTILGPKSELQPDLLLRLDKRCSGQSESNEEDYLVGAPELVAEVAHSSVAIDLGSKREDYLATGVQEYLVLCAEERELR